MTHHANPAPRPALYTSGLMGPHEIGTAGYRAWMNIQHVNALAMASCMMLDGATPRQVADFVLSLGIVGAGVSRCIENAAYPGTVAAAVFEILAG